MPKRVLLAINYIGLTLFLIVIIDLVFLNGYLKTILPTSPTIFIWYHVLFGLPHIVASFVSYGNKNYLSYYKKNILAALALTIGILVFFSLFAPSLFIYFLIGYTLYHFTRQQIGLCRGYLRTNKLFPVWSAAGITTGITLALSIGGEGLAYVPAQAVFVLQCVGVLSLAIFTLTSVALRNTGQYVLSTSAVIIFAGVSILLGYYAVGIIMLTFVHDTSAFSIYIKHDTWYQKKMGDNFLYTLFKIKTKYIIVALPIISILIAYILQKYTLTLFLGIILFLTFMHYYLEGIIWRKGTLHRSMLE